MFKTYLDATYCSAPTVNAHRAIGGSIGPQAPPTLNPFCRPVPTSGSALMLLCRHPVPRWHRDFPFEDGSLPRAGCSA